MGYEMFFDELRFHCLAWSALYLQMIFTIFANIEGLNWLSLTLKLALLKLLYFFFAYVVLLVGFAVLFSLHFGQRFVQFSTIRRSFVEIFLLSVGSPANVFDDIY